MQILLVGGAVRNLLLGRPVADKDFLVNGITKEEFVLRFPEAKEVGDHFPVFLINGEEYAFLRSDTIENDFLARDFTINALAIDEEGHLLAHPSGLEDLSMRKLAPASNSSFNIDPLRIFRAARFLSELDDFTPTAELLENMRSASVNGLTNTLAAERVGKELLRALSSSSPSNFLKYLNKTNNLKPWFKEFEAASAIPAGPQQHHNRSILGHTMEVMDRLAGQGSLRVWMGMVHDLGKCTTPKELLPRHIDHDKRGEIMAVTFAQRLRLSNTYVKAGAKAARWHMVASNYTKLRAGTKVVLLSALGSLEAVADTFAMCHADREIAPDHSTVALKDYERIFKVSLPSRHRNLGTKSGEILHQLRAKALSD